MSKKGKQSLADKIAGLLSAAPKSFDPEENVDEETIAKVTENDVEEHSDEEIILSNFRKQNIDLLEDIDSKYAGRTVSRKDLRDSDEDDSVVSEEEIDNNEESESEEESNEEMTGTEDDEVSQSGTEEDEVSQSGTEEESDVGDFKHFRDTDVNKHVSKGLCVKNQLGIWENLLEIRIQLQKCLITSNKMPQLGLHKEIRESSQDFAGKVKETKRTLVSTLNKMLELQQMFIKNYPETKTVLAKKKVEKEENSDEEIPSDTEDEETEEIPIKKMKYSEFEEGLATLHDTYKPFRNSAIQKWNDKTRIATGKRSAGTHSVLNQIEHSLSDRQKLIDRTQTKRTEYEILGAEKLSERNPEIFDDDDFYHQLLRELIEVKTADLTDPVQLGRQWLQLQNLRGKMKRKIDTKATKGRKIRYTVHTKLVNFMAPMDECTWTDEAKTELYGSLFGKSQVAT